MVALHYFPADKNSDKGNSEHEDGNFITYVFQDDVGGLQVPKDGVWISVVPAEGTIVVNTGDVIQVVRMCTRELRRLRVDPNALLLERESKGIVRAVLVEENKIVKKVLKTRKTGREGLRTA